MNLVVKKNDLPIYPNRYPSLLEKIVLGMSCIGYCDGQTPENINNCWSNCGSQSLSKELNK